jgi:hypothetical protein
MNGNWIARALVGAVLLAGALAPAAHADDPLAPIKAAVLSERGRTSCPALAYNLALEGIAQRHLRNQETQNSGYAGHTVLEWGFGDPVADAIEDTLELGGRDMIANCGFTDFGVGFIRDDDVESDEVAIVFGAPAPPQPPPAPPITLTPIPAAEPLTPPVVAPTNAVQVSFDRGLQWTVNVASTADIRGTCTYSATNPLLPGANRDFSIDPRGTTSFTVMAPPPLSVYHVVVSCSGPFDGKTVEFGHFEQDVRA